MDFGVTGKLGGCYLAEQYRKNAAAKAAGTGNFAGEVQKAAEGKNAAEKSSSSAWAGDMVVPNPPSYFGFTYDSSISNKPKEEMTTDEYKQWFMNEMSKMPVSSWFRSSFSSGSLVIKEEAFERMKNDPEYEKYVMNRIRSMYSVSSLPVGPNNVCYEVIGASPEECYGYAGPTGGSGSNFAGDEKTWWEKRHERMEELMEEQEKEAVKKAQARKAAVQENYLKSQMASRQRLQAFLVGEMQSGDDAAAFQTAGLSALAATVYEENISAFSKSVVRDF